MKLSELVAAYVKIRDAVKQSEKERKEHKAKLEAQLDVVGRALQTYLKKSDADSSKTAYGTVYKATAEYVGVSDWEEFLRFFSEQIVLILSSYRAIEVSGDNHFEELVGLLVDKAPWHFFNQSLKKSAVLDYMEEHDDALPPGAKYDSETTVNVRK